MAKSVPADAKPQTGDAYTAFWPKPGCRTRQKKADPILGPQVWAVIQGLLRALWAALDSSCGRIPVLKRSLRKTGESPSSDQDRPIFHGYRSRQLARTGKSVSRCPNARPAFFRHEAFSFQKKGKVRTGNAPNRIRARRHATSPKDQGRVHFQRPISELGGDRA